MTNAQKKSDRFSVEKMRNPLARRTVVVLGVLIVFPLALLAMAVCSAWSPFVNWAKCWADDARILFRAAGNAWAGRPVRTNAEIVRDYHLPISQRPRAK